MFFPLAVILETQKRSLAAKDTYKKRLRSKIWSFFKFGSNYFSRNLRNLRKRFQNTPRNKKIPNSEESNRVALFSTGCFDFSIGCFLNKLKKGFEIALFLLCGLKPNPAFPKTQF